MASLLGGAGIVMVMMTLLLMLEALTDLFPDPGGFEGSWDSDDVN